MSYYTGTDPDKDLEAVQEKAEMEILYAIGSRIGYGRAQQIVELIRAGTTSFIDEKMDMEVLAAIAKNIGHRQACRIMQFLWAKSLNDQGINPIGALGPD